jgi:hypothetical protein
MRIFDIFKENDQVPDSASKPVSASEPKPNPQFNPTDKVTMNIPLLLRIMEYSKEDARTDMDLHHVVEKLVSLSSNGQSLDMNNYNDIIGSVPEGDAPAEKLVKDIEYHPKDNNDEEVQEGYGRYWCSTDKRWKERKGPKQSRS